MKEAYPRLASAGARVLAISADTVASHQRFAATLGGLPFPLLSDANCEVIAAYGVLNEKSTGARRSVFVLDDQGAIVYANERYDLSNPAHLLAILSAAGVVPSILPSPT